MTLRNLRSTLRCLLRRPYYLFIGIFLFILLTYIITGYIHYLLYLSNSIKFVGDLSNDTLLMTWASRRALKEFIRPEEITEILSPVVPYCSNLMVLVTTVVPHFEQRQAIRDTWGQQLNVYFFLGRAAGEKAFLEDEAKLAGEKHVYEDLIVEDFIESYYNLTLKTAFMMKWALRHCPETEFILKTDDDMFVNPSVLRKSIANISSYSRTMIGRVIIGRYAHRDPESKWYLPKNMYPEEILPPYISGTAYLMSNVAMREIYKAAMEASFISLEDILFTGILAKQLNITLICDMTYTENKPPSWNVIQRMMGTSECSYRRLAVAHRLSPSELFSAWFAVTDPQYQRICSTWFQTKLVNITERFL